MKIVIAIIIVWFVRLIINGHYLIKSVDLKDKYIKYWNKELPNAQIYTPEIKKVFLKAGINSYFFSFAQPVGYGYYSNGKAPIIDNLFYYDNRLIMNVISLFDQAIGTFRSRIIENFNPIFWIEFVIFLPKNIFKYLGFNTSSIPIKLFQIVYWVSGAFYTIYSDQINKLIQDFLSNLFK